MDKDASNLTSTLFQNELNKHHCHIFSLLKAVLQWSGCLQGKKKDAGQGNP